MASRTNNVNRLKIVILFVFVLLLAGAFWKAGTRAERVQSAPAQAIETPTPTPAPTAEPAPAAASTPAAAALQPAAPPLEGCIKCHGNIEPMHRYNNQGDVFEKVVEGKDAQGLTCTSCHGGNPAATLQKEAHVQPKYPKEWGCKGGDCSSANPERSNTLIAKESREFVRFINPGDFRVIAQSCGSCHSTQNQNSSTSMMAHGAMLWGAALYNNGGYHIKDPAFGESYSEDGNPQALFQSPAPTREQQAFKGFLTSLYPLPRWELSQPGNILRVFERGSKRRLEVGLPDKEEEPG